MLSRRRGTRPRSQCCRLERNPWPEPNILSASTPKEAEYANDKDVVEVYLFHAVRSRKADLTRSSG